MVRMAAGDIGGTNVRLRCVESTGEVSAERRYESGRYHSFDDILREFAGRCPGPIDTACFAVAGPVVEGRAEVTNLKWIMVADDLERAFGIRQITLINDFYAIALGVPLLGDGDLLSLQKGERDRTAPMAIIGAGTGLGEAMIMFYGGNWEVVPSEGGHADFAPQDEEQTQLLIHLFQRYRHVSWERVCSGMGMSNIYSFLSGHKEIPARISELAVDGDAHATTAMRMFVDIYGSEAGNMALRGLSRGGVFLAGGIAAKNARFFTDGRFIEAFLRKGRFKDFLTTIPVDLITNEGVGLLGAMEMARRTVMNDQ
ncbi:MAG TPA: glucokinase [Thermoanaerobaculia bacterium]|nr:glucokinase [Thermoanaerobaculia bacterium]